MIEPVKVPEIMSSGEIAIAKRREKLNEPVKVPEIMSSGEIAIAKRREKLNELLQHGDPFTDRFICSLGEIACITKEILETERIPRYVMGPGINGSKIFKYGPCESGKDFSCIKPIRDKLNEQMEKFRIGFGLWEHTYSFENYDQMVKEILSVLLDNPKQITEANNGNN